MDTPEQITFPQTSVNITEQGMIVQIAFTPTSALNQMIPAEMMDQVTKQWRELRRAQNNQLTIIQDIKKSKIN